MMTELSGHNRPFTDLTICGGATSGKVLTRNNWTLPFPVCSSSRTPSRSVLAFSGSSQIADEGIGCSANNASDHRS